MLACTTPCLTDSQARKIVPDEQSLSLQLLYFEALCVVQYQIHGYWCLLTQMGTYLGMSL